MIFWETQFSILIVGTLLCNYGNMLLCFKVTDVLPRTGRKKLSDSNLQMHPLQFWIQGTKDKARNPQMCICYGANMLELSERKPWKCFLVFTYPQLCNIDLFWVKTYLLLPPAGILWSMILQDIRKTLPFFDFLTKFFSKNIHWPFFPSPPSHLLTLQSIQEQYMDSCVSSSSSG